MKRLLAYLKRSQCQASITTSPGGLHLCGLHARHTGTHKCNSLACDHSWENTK